MVLETSMGTIIIELYSLHAPKTCQNFLELSRKGYYSGVVFHRVINEFMVQTGDPTGTGKGGTSIFGDKFEDEIVSCCCRVEHTEEELMFWWALVQHPELHFTGAGILAVRLFVLAFVVLQILISFGSIDGEQRSQHQRVSVSSPPCSRCVNSSIRSFTDTLNFCFRFFITLGPTPHLDKRHTIFGRVLSGMKVVERLGAVAVDADDRFVSSFGLYSWFISSAADRDHSAFPLF